MPLLPSIPEQTALGPALRRFPIAGNALLDYRSALMFSGEPLGLAECELVATYVSALNRCSYCVGSHGVVAEAHGVSSALLADLVDDPARVDFNGRLAPLFALVEKLTLQPSAVARDEIEASRGAGWSDGEIAHAVSVCAFFNGMNRIADGIGLEKTPPDIEAARARVASRPTRRIDAAEALLRHHAGLMRGPSPLSIGEREALACLVSALNGCERGIEAHRATAQAHGMASEILARMVAEPSEPIEDRLAPLAAYVRTLTATPGAIGSADVQRVFDAGWSEEALFHAISVCAHAHLLDRLAACPAVPSDARIAALYADAVPIRG